MIAEVIVDILASPVDRIFDYSIPKNLEEKLSAGYRVLVPFANRRVEGIAVCVKDHTDFEESRLKSVLSLLDDVPLISPEMMALLWHLSEHSHMLLADVLRLFIPAEMRGGKVKDKTALYIALADRETAERIQFKSNAVNQAQLLAYMLEYGDKWVKKSELSELFSAAAINALIKKGVLRENTQRVARSPYTSLRPDLAEGRILTPDQQKASERILAAYGTDRCFLLHGVTGSGKTEIYLTCIAECLKRNRTAILLVPEIALTPQMLRIFRTRFSDQVAILHSGLSAGERFDEWWRLKTGEAKIAIGARSAIFAPLTDVGIIIIDEEHDTSYVPDGGKYDTKDVAEFRAAYHGAVQVYGSATPSVETYYRALNGKIGLIELKSRINRKPLPKVTVVDMREEVRFGNNGIFSAELKRQLDVCMAANNQAMLFINRRGYASIVMCKECGYVAKCSDCDVTLTYHREEDVLKCHYCSQRFKMPMSCPKCGSKYIKQGGLGTERVVAELEKMYPDISVLRMDNDTTQTKEAHFQIVRDFSEKKANILVGTQMIAKGHDFKDVSLVGILDADLGLYFSDYRSAERTFQLITQVSGRAGRADIEGSVVLQTYSPQHEIYRFAISHDYQSFYRREIALREATHYPPFATIVRFAVSGEDEPSAIDCLKRNYDDISLMSKKYSNDFLYLNKMRSPIKRIQKKFRYQILMRITGQKQDEILDLLHAIRAANDTRGVTSHIEVNPNSMV